MDEHVQESINRFKEEKEKRLKMLEKGMEYRESRVSSNKKAILSHIDSLQKEMAKEKIDTSYLNFLTACLEERLKDYHYSLIVLKDFKKFIDETKQWKYSQAGQWWNRFNVIT